MKKREYFPRLLMISGSGRNVGKTILGCRIVEQLNEKIDGKLKNITNKSPKSFKHTPTDNHLISTSSTHPSTHKLPFESLKTQNIPISIGNGGVPTDRQTDKQTNRQTNRQTS